MILSHDNAAVEGGFSINKGLLIDSMLEETVVAQRVVFGVIWNAGMDIKNVDITAQMVTAVLHTSQHLKVNRETRLVKNRTCEITRNTKP